MRHHVLGIMLGAALISSCGRRPNADGWDELITREPPAITLTEDLEPPLPGALAWAAVQPSLVFFNTRTGAQGALRLYTPGGTIDEAAARAIDVVLAERDTPARPLNRRLFQLVVKAAAHFHASDVHVVSSFRDKAGKGSRHRGGEALDFSLAGVPSSKLAAYLRSCARVGVGVYTHKRTQYVHLDVREESYHWADASPPGHSWRESRMTDRAAAARDAAYRPEQDLPNEG